MSDRVLLLVGTRKGGFVVESAPERRRWKVRGPYLAGQNVMHMNFDLRTGLLFAAAWDWWFGSRVHRSFDEGRTWEEPISSPAFPGGADWKLDKVWQVTPGRAHEPGVVYAGIEPAALFKSTDDGRTWAWVESLSRHPTRQEWQPGAGGLTLHTVVLDHARKDRVFAAISAAGLFRSDDGGQTWHPKNQGVRANFMPDQPAVYPEWGQCVHKLLQHPAKPDLFYQQNHCGVYRSDDGGDSWTEITNNLPSDWGLPIAVHPHEPGTVFVCPGQNGYLHWVPNARMAVHRTTDGGATWTAQTKGLPARNAFLNTLRDGMASDALDPCGVYVGTNTGQVYYSRDTAGSWNQLPALFPPINSVEAITLR